MKSLLRPRIHDRRPLAAAALMLWIAISPWLWGFADSHSAVANHVAIVFGFGPLALLTVNLRPAAVVTLFAGAWLVMSPWLIGYASDHAAWLNDLVSGLLVIVLCATALGLPTSLVRRSSLRKGRSRAGAIAETAGSRS